MEAVEPLRALALSVLAAGCLAVGVIVESPNAAPRPGPQVPTFRSAATTVEVDVIVKDAAGKFVPDLGQADFRLVEDGTAREIDTFYLVRGTGDTPESRQGVPPKEPPPVLISNPPPAAVHRLFVFHFDTEHMAPGGVIRAQRATAEFLSREFQAGDVGGVVGGGSMLNSRLTSAAEELRTAVAGIKPQPDVRSRELDMREWPRVESLYEAARVDAGDERVIGMLADRACADDRDRCFGSGGEDVIRHEILVKSRSIIGQARTSAQRTLSTLERLVLGLAPLPGRKTILFLSPIADSLMAQARDGWAAYQRGDTKTALTVLSAPAENPAAPPWVNYVLGWAAFAEGQWVVARNAWNVVRATVPDFIPVYFDIADAYLRQGKPAEALVVLRAADSRWPGSLEVLNAVGVVQTSVGQLDEAIGQFEKALAAAPSDSSTRFNLGGAKELRYVRSLRQLVPAEPDRRDAITEYRRVAEASGPFSEAARAGLHRLTPLDIRSLEYTPPVVFATLTQTVLHGRPVRLAWSRDGQQVYVMGLSSKTEGHVLVSVPAGAVTLAPSAPDWSRTYWSWKAAQRAPWLPSVVIKSETKRVTAFNSTDPGNPQRAYAPSGTQSTSNVLLLHGEVIAEANSGYVLPGFTFSWSPFAMGALAFVTSRNRLAIMDSEGRKIEVAGTHDVGLPAWSEDGTRIAYVVPAGNNWVLQLISLSVRD